MKRIQIENIQGLIAGVWEKFRLKIPPDLREAESTTLAGLGLSLIALVLLGIGVLSGRSDLPTGLLVVTALICFLSSAVMIALGGGRGIPADCVATLEQGTQISMARICSDLGCDGNAHYCAGQKNDSVAENPSADANLVSIGTSVWQFNPARSVGQVPDEGTKNSSGEINQSLAKRLKYELIPNMDKSRGTGPVFQANGPIQGMFSIPPGLALLSWLQMNHGLQIGIIIQHSEEDGKVSGSLLMKAEGEPDTVAFSELLTSVYSEILGCAEEVTVSREGDGALVVQITGFALFSGCKKVAEESQNVCSMIPCAFCSLLGCIVSSVTDQVWTLSHVRLIPEKRSVMTVWELVE